MITMILCWVLYAKSIIGLVLPILSTVFYGLYLILMFIKCGMKLGEYRGR